MIPSRTGPAFRALRHHNFRLFVTGQFISLSGTWMQSVALGWLVLTMTDSAFAVGLVGATGTLPVLLFTLQGGALASRSNRLRMVTILQSLMLVEAVALTALTWSGHVTLGWVVVLALTHGLLSAYEIPARQTLLLDLVGREDLMNAVAINSSTFNLSRVIGPALGGMILAVTGPAVCFGINAVSYLGVLVSLFRIRLDPALVAPARARPSMREALQFVLNPGWPRTLVILSATYTIFAMSFLTILPVYARDALGLGAAGYGWLTAAFGVGAAGGALLLAGFGPTRARGHVALRAGVVIGSAILLLSIAPVAPLAFVLLVAAGASLSTNAITTNTLLQTEAPDELRGHVIGFYAFIVVGLAPFGALQVGLVSEFAGVRVAVALGGIVCLAMTLWMTFQIRHTLGGAIDRRKSAQTEESYSWQERRQ